MCRSRAFHGRPGRTRTYANHSSRKRERRLAVEKRGVRVTLIKSARCDKCAGGERQEFELTTAGRAAVPPRHVTVESEIVQVDELHLISESSMAIVGRVQAYVSMVIWSITPLVRLSTSFSVSRRSWRRMSNSSPMRRVYPTHFVEGVSSEYLVYDFTRAPSQTEAKGFSLTIRSMLYSAIPDRQCQSAW